MPFKEVDATVLNADLVTSQNLVAQNATFAKISGASLTLGAQSAGVKHVNLNTKG